jgi:membrane-bound metal-dependent hydrolase YbcI (DUF457 family)
VTAGAASPQLVPASTRSSADATMRRLLRVPDGPAAVKDDDAHRLFSASIALSGLRCLLGYIVFPIVLPAVGAAAAIGPAIGLPIGILALVFDVRGMRRFWLANHRYRCGITALYAAVMVLVTVLVVRDIVHLAR